MKVKAMGALLSKAKPSPVEGIHIRPHATESNVVIIYNQYTPLGFVEFSGGKSTLNWATPCHGTYATHKVELPYADLWDDFTLEIAQQLAEQYLL